MSGTRASSKKFPPVFQRLLALSRDLWWTWQDLDEAFRNSALAEPWKKTGGNLNAFLDGLSPGNQKKLAQDQELVSRINRLHKKHQDHLKQKSTWADGALAKTGGGLSVAYFCSEFGLWTHLPIYSGGLGVLAGDHLKSASDLGLPLCAMGLWYSHGYFRQEVAANGQHEFPERPRPEHLPMTLVTRRGKPLLITLPLGGKTLTARIWRTSAGRVDLFLLDTDFQDNPTSLRKITHELYVGDRPTRLQQEWLLGVGGHEALKAMNRLPKVFHMNEGHSGLVALPLLQEAMAAGRTLRRAVAWVKSRMVFTTHTQEDAGHERYDRELIEPLFTPYADAMGLSAEDLLALGRPPEKKHRDVFCLTTWCLRLSGHANGVSKRHGAVARKSWGALWPDKETEKVPIGHITNGIHAPTWTPAFVKHRLETAAGPHWQETPWTRAQLKKAMAVEDAQLWAWRRAVKQEALSALEPVLRPELSQRGPRPDPGALTIGFARRFAVYKRAGLLFQDLERLGRLLNDQDRPVQLLFAGKAHPKDTAGKAVLAQVMAMCRRKPFKGRIWVVENYNIATAQTLLHGVDVWLNTPEWPREASGTSGMKAVLSGALNVSVLDGWWEEAWADAGALSTPVGFAVHPPAKLHKAEVTAVHDAKALYTVLEKKVIPMFYHRDAAGTPLQWTAAIKSAFIELGAVYTTHRMVAEYLHRYYLPAFNAVQKHS